ncbi:MAG: histidine triad nucleotide-binding protein [Dehalococcoidia bacterium]
MAEDCLFCRMATGAIAVEKLYDQGGVFAIRDVNPRAPVHVLVIPTEHIPMVSELAARHGELLAQMYLAANMLARQERIAQSGYRCAFNVGADAGQTIYHIHMHLLGGRKLGAEG